MVAFLKPRFYFYFWNSSGRELFDAVDVMAGNDPIAENIQILLNGVKTTEVFDILTLLQFETEIGEVFVNWQPIEGFLKSLGIDDESIDILAEAELNLPEVST